MEPKKNILDIKEKYPKIFKDIHHTNFGFPTTWYDLVDNLCLEIQLYCDTHNCDQVVCSQIKEKFGMLRFYVNSAPEKIYSIIDDHEDRSSKICQNCGCSNCETNASGKWIAYLCKNCQ